MDPRRLALICGGTSEDVRSVGSGYLIGPRLVLTARHVVTQKGLDAPWPAIEAQVGHPGEVVVRTVGVGKVWPHPSGLDVALLLLDDDVAVPEPVRWGRPTGRGVLQYEALGFPRASVHREKHEVEHLRGDLPLLSSGTSRHYVLDQRIAPDPQPDGRKAWAGASGAAVFCESRLVGVVVQYDQAHGNRRLRACPAHDFARNDVFEKVLARYGDGTPDLGEIRASLPGERPPTERSSFDLELEQSLWQWLGSDDRSASHARPLAERLGYSVPTDYKPTTRNLVDLVATDPRALPSLSGTLAGALTAPDSRDQLTALLTRARATGTSLLLSLDEHERLLSLLRDTCGGDPALLPRSAREALRYAVLPEPVSRPGFSAEDLEAAVEALEELSDGEPVPSGTPTVPALLRVIEYLAAAVGEERGEELRRWSNGVAGRTGIHQTALHERREDAQRWGAQKAAPMSRVVLELTTDRAAGEERYFCRTFLARQDGTHSPLHESMTVSRTPEEVARYLCEVVESVAGEWDRDVPWVKVLVDEKGLHLAVDEWNPGASNPYVPGLPIGAEFRLTLSCPQMSATVRSRDDDQRRRWKEGSAESLVTDGTKLVQALKSTSHRNTNRVVLHAPRGAQQERLLAICLALGVPVVLWDREGGGFEGASIRRRLDPAGQLSSLPERVRDFRNEVFDDPPAHSARPSLVWEDGNEGLEPASLKLMDPRKDADLP
ncbi:trypsin-like peptidase domain-containing protein [Kitasatospora sp. NPDC051170]|uniref:VMAP-C domain-containing protein n=1 Tax=Kitasatospora sp. NPDC051170 TaxID=3364056 RepID=UPI00378C6560